MMNGVGYTALNTSVYVSRFCVTSNQSLYDCLHACKQVFTSDRSRDLFSLHPFPRLRPIQHPIQWYQGKAGGAKDSV